MPLQTRLSALITAIGADIKSVSGRISTIETTPSTTIIDGGSAPTETYTGVKVIAGGEVGHMVHIGPTNQLFPGVPGLWIDTSIPNSPTFWIEDGA